MFQQWTDRLDDFRILHAIEHFQSVDDLTLIRARKRATERFERRRLRDIHPEVAEVDLAALERFAERIDVFLSHYEYQCQPDRQQPKYDKAQLTDRQTHHTGEEKENTACDTTEPPVDKDKRLRGNAIEFLDNVLKKQVKKYLFPIVDNVPDDFKIKTGRELFGMEFSDRNSALEYLIGGADPWLASCAIYNVEETSPPRLRTAVEKKLTDPYPIVQESARAVLRQ